MPILLRPDGAFRFIPAASEKSGYFANLQAAELKAFGGAGNGVRTRDPKLGKLVLYQLSYARANYYMNTLLTEKLY